MCDDLKHAIMKMLISKTSLGKSRKWLGISKEKTQTFQTIKTSIKKVFLEFVKLQNVSDL
jgi:hypothetical protein